MVELGLQVVLGVWRWILVVSSVDILRRILHVCKPLIGFLASGIGKIRVQVFVVDPGVLLLVCHGRQ